VLLFSFEVFRMAKHDLRFSPVASYDLEQKDIIDYLYKQPQGIMLVPYAKEGFSFCAPYTQIAGASGQFTADGYCFWFFTLSGQREGEFVLRQNWWKEETSFQQEVLSLIDNLSDKNKMLITRNQYLQELRERLKFLKPDLFDQLEFLQFKNFSLVKRKS
jgi:hypothetical protein